MDWDLIKSFIAVCEHGSVTAAAGRLGVSQPTLSRQIQALELQTQLNLFKRTTQGLVLTTEGHRLVESARQMNDAAALFSRQVTGLSADIEGDVRISANEIVGNYLLPPAIAALRQQHPGVHLEIVITNQASSLSKREADIALRMFRPQQADLVVRRLPALELGFYAHEQYLQQYGTPTVFKHLLDHCFIGYDTDLSFIEGAAQLGIELKRDNFAIRSDYLMTQFALLRSAAGIGITHVGLAEQHKELVRLLVEVPLEKLEFWCVCHSDVQYSSRIRTVMRFLSQWFAQHPYANSIV